MLIHLAFGKKKNFVNRVLKERKVINPLFF